MSLAKYKTKRDFSRTPEPAGSVRRHAAKALRFVIQKHDASRLHYDFRLELDGVLKSWAVPKGPSLDPSRKSLAVQVEDHPIEYGDFEGVIPQGQYGGGTVLLWDNGTWEPLHDPSKGFREGKLHFTLHGKKLQGEWSLVRMHGKAGGDGKNWLLIKVKDKYASSDRDILADESKSVKTRRSIEQIADNRDDVWSADAKKTAKVNGAKKGALPAHFSPQLAVLAENPPEGKDWLHEIKFDGYRIMAWIKAGNVKLITRGGKDWTHKFPEIAKTLAKLKVDSAIIDGEAIVVDAEGRSDFQALQAMLKEHEKARPIYYAFDLPFCNGYDLRESPLIERKAKLEEILQNVDLGPIVNFSQHVIGDGKKLIDKACSMTLEGIISKRADSPYVSSREPTWLKSKCEQRQEFIVIGYTDPKNSRVAFGSLLLGYHDKEGNLLYAGRVGTGFDVPMLKATLKNLAELSVKDPPTDVAPPARERRAAHWVQPKIVAEVKFTGWTRDGMLRHPAFVAFRSDKPAKQIVREIPMKPLKNGKPARQTKASTKSFHTRHSKSLAGPLAGRSPGPEKTSKKSDHPVDGDSDADTVAGIKLSHPGKVLYPEQGVTKRQLAEYYESVAEWMLPHVVDRPLALVRCPGGMSTKCFFQRNWSDTLPPAIDKIDVGIGKSIETHVAVHDLSGIISLAQIGVLEIHTWNCANRDVDHPDQLVFDLDPGPDVAWKQVTEGVRMLNRRLKSLGLPTFLKLSGGKGVHVTVPIVPKIDWDSAKSFTETIAKSLVQKSDLFVANMRKDLRHGKIYIDYNRNGRGATAVAPYSTRARAGASISMPISWEELGKLKSADHFTVDTARRYLARRKTDPWASFERSRIDLHKLVSGGVSPG